MPSAVVAANACISCLRTCYSVDENGHCPMCRRSASNIPPLPPFPTKHLPGTVGKVEVMKWRDDQGYRVHHPLDRTEDERPNLPGQRGPSQVEREPRVLRRLARHG